MSDVQPRKPKPLNHRNVLTQSGRFGPNMTPMVDVTLVILIFFMASASIAGHEWFLNAHLPETQTDQTPSGFSLPTPTLNAALYVDHDRVMVRGIGDESRRLEAVIKQIRSMPSEQASGLVLSILASDDVSYESVVALHDAAASVSMRVAIR
jgi:biopolymer transport protein ExbD